MLVVVESSWNVMAHGDAREGKWRGNWRMEWAASTPHTTSELGISSITTADAHTSAASSRLNLRPRRFKWTHPFRRKTKSGFCACAITFQTQSKYEYYPLLGCDAAMFSCRNMTLLSMWDVGIRFCRNICGFRPDYKTSRHRRVDVQIVITLHVITLELIICLFAIRSSYYVSSNVKC